ncbi:MAG: hypothetical protein R2712_13375 [Vicinamibacterales bacterium]
MLQEDRPVEQLTFLFLAAAGGLALRLGLSGRTRTPAWTTAFFCTFGFGLLLVAMEEVSWGQRFLGFDTPPLLDAVNAQGEANLHNIGPLQGRSEWMRLVFGVGGLVGIALGSDARWQRVAVPRVLLSWFGLITAHAAIDVWNDIWPIEERFDFLMQRTSEVVELMIGIAAFLYVWLHMRQAAAAADAR